jgi:hypothetical protein
LPVSSGQDAVAENNEVEVKATVPVDTLEVVSGPGVLQGDESASVPTKPKRTRAPRKKKEPILPIAEHVVVLERVQETDTGNGDIAPEIVVEAASEVVTKSKRRPRKKSAKKEVEAAPQQQPQSLPVPEASIRTSARRDFIFELSFQPVAFITKIRFSATVLSYSNWKSWKITPILLLRYGTSDFLMRWRLKPAI